MTTHPNSNSDAEQPTNVHAPRGVGRLVFASALLLLAFILFAPQHTLGTKKIEFAIRMMPTLVLATLVMVICGTVLRTTSITLRWVAVVIMLLSLYIGLHTIWTAITVWALL